MMTNTERDQLIIEHAEMAKRVAGKLARRCPRELRDDLVAAGLVGLTEAARRFDDSQPFVPFALTRIRGAVMDEMRRGDMLPRRVRQSARKVAATIKLLEQTGATPSDQQVADKLGVSVEEYRVDLKVLLTASIASIDEEGAPALVADTQSPAELAARREILARIRAAVAQLERRDATLLGLHYIEEMTFQEIGTTLGITASRACQLLKRAVERLREQLGAATLCS
jgi:RNA polymerase sigma factor for flagellar operon FliA